MGAGSSHNIQLTDSANKRQHKSNLVVILVPGFKNGLNSRVRNGETCAICTIGHGFWWWLRGPMLTKCWIANPSFLAGCSSGQKVCRAHHWCSRIEEFPHLIGGRSLGMHWGFQFGVHHWTSTWSCAAFCLLYDGSEAKSACQVWRPLGNQLYKDLFIFWALTNKHCDNIMKIHSYMIIYVCIYVTVLWLYLSYNWVCDPVFFCIHYCLS